MHTDDTRDPSQPSPFDALRTGMASLNTPPAIKKELMAAFARQHRPRRWYHQLSPSQWGVAGGVGSVAAVLLAFMLSLHAPGRIAGDAAGVAPAARDDNGAAFIALASFERIEQEPAPRVVEATVPRTALSSLGVPVTPENAGDSVRAEMLVAADGRPLALRLASE
jgi:hypothetical protein